MAQDSQGEPLCRSAKRVLVMRYRFIGDTILTVPFLRNLRRSYPNAQIDVLVGPQSGEVLSGCPYVDSFIVFDTTRFHKYDRSELKARNYWSYVGELRKNSYDLVFVLKRSLSSAFLAFATGARYRVGYATEGRGLLLTHKVAWNRDLHEVQSTLDVLKAANVPVEDDGYLEAWISPAERAAIEKKVPQLAGSTNSGNVLVHAAAAHPDKMYPTESWAEVVRALHQELKLTPFFTGAKGDRELYDQIAGMAQVPCLNLAGELTLRESMAVYEKMNLAVCVDSGPAHLSAAVGTPTLALFGPTDPQRWRPYGPKHRALYDSSLPCRPCHYHKTCDDRPCLTKMNPLDVVKNLRELYAGEGAALL